MILLIEVPIRHYVFTKVSKLFCMESSAAYPMLDIIRECGTTLYVGMAYPAPPTNTNFQITFLLTRLWKALYEDLPV